MTRVVFQIVFLLLVLQAAAQTEFTYPSLVVEYDSAVIFRNLKLIPIKRKEPHSLADSAAVPSHLLTLKEGMKSGGVKLKERGDYMLDNINILMVENTTGKDLFIRSGEIAVGGRQDRVFAKDTILPGSITSHTVPVYCIEENRWSKYEKKFTYGGNTNSGLQKLIDSTSNQTLVWDEIRRWLKANNQTKSSSFAALLGNKKMTDTSNAYIRYFLQQLPLKDSNTVGIIASTGNRVLGADVFLSPSLFYQTITQVLEKYTAEALLQGSTPAAQHERESKYANELFTLSTQQEVIRKRGKNIFYKGVLIQITAH